MLLKLFQQDVAALEEYLRHLTPDDDISQKAAETNTLIRRQSPGNSVKLRSAMWTPGKPRREIPATLERTASLFSSEVSSSAPKVGFQLEREQVDFDDSDDPSAVKTQARAKISVDHTHRGRDKYAHHSGPLPPVPQEAAAPGSREWMENGRKQLQKSLPMIQSHEVSQIAGCNSCRDTKLTDCFRRSHCPDRLAQDRNSLE